MSFSVTELKRSYVSLSFTDQNLKKKYIHQVCTRSMVDQSEGAVCGLCMQHCWPFDVWTPKLSSCIKRKEKLISGRNSAQDLVGSYPRILIRSY